VLARIRRRDVDICERQHRAQCAACRTAAWPHDDRQRFRDIERLQRAQRAKAPRLTIVEAATQCIPDFARIGGVLSELRCIPVPDALLATAADRRTHTMFEDLSHNRAILRRYMRPTAMLQRCPASPRCRCPGMECGPDCRSA